MTTTTHVQLNKLPQTTIIFRIKDGTIHYILIMPKYKHTHLVQYVSVVMASNDTLTFYFCFEMPYINYFKNIRVQHNVCVVCRLEDAEPRLQTTVR